MNYRNLKQKKSWKTILPAAITDNESAFYSEDSNQMERYKTQADFLREYYPSGHSIFDRIKYPDIYRTEDIPVLDDNGEPTGEVKHKTYVELLPRYAFAFQQIIALKQMIHLAGNETQCELASAKHNENDIDNFNRLKEGWAMKDMEITLFKAYNSVKVTGDAAVVFYMDNGEMKTKVLSYLYGDILYPHYDALGRISIFARSFYSQDEQGNNTCEYLEVYDDTNITLLKRGVGEQRTFKQKMLGVFGIDGYEMVSQLPHGLNRIPIAYFRDENGPCWTAAQNAIDGYEFAFSQMVHSNQAFGFPIMTLQGENVEAVHDLNGTIKMITLGPDDKADFMKMQDASGSFFKQLDTLYKLIYEQCFVVTPPEMKSGDLPAAALKILYSPAYEKATYDAQMFKPFLNDIAALFTLCYGIECQNTIGFDNLKVHWWIKPYIHINWSTTINDLATAVQSGFLSKETASQRIDEYATVGEYEKIIKELKQQNQQTTQNIGFTN